MVPPHRILLVSDFNLSILAGCLSRADGRAWQPTTVDYGQLIPTLLSASPPAADAALVWSQPGAAVPAFKDALTRRPVALEQLLPQVDEFASALATFAGRYETVAVPTWVIPSQDRGYGPLDFRAGVGLRYALARMNLELADRLAGVDNVYLLDADRWLQRVGPTACDPGLWLAAKSPFAPDVYREAVADLDGLMGAVTGQTKKLVVVDLDNTLWGGVVGEVGLEGITLGGHDPVGEAYAAFQDALAGLVQRGILLAISSKNDERIALACVERHPEMRLRLDHFAAYRINWNDKAANLVDLVAQLNLGLDAVVFIDDNPAERGRIREALPDVYVPEWPADPKRYADALLGLRCFDAATVTREDSERARMYAVEQQRQTLRAAVGSADEWLESLQMRVEIEALDDANLARAAQLLNKTNQMNLATRRLSAPELAAWAAGAGRRTTTFRVSDRYGESGLTGLLSVEQRAEVLEIVDFVLSCRVFGRRIEQAMMSEAVADARQRGCALLRATYQPTAKNRPCLEFLQQSGLAETATGTRFEWAVDQDFPSPPAIALVRRMPLSVG